MYSLGIWDVAGECKSMSTPPWCYISWKFSQKIREILQINFTKSINKLHLTSKSLLFLLLYRYLHEKNGYLMINANK